MAALVKSNTQMNDNNKELFIVEGQSAASTLQQVANPRKHHILPLQGKLINVEKASTNKVMANEICLKLLDVLGCGVGADCKVDQLPFSRIIILSDPDMDGTHSRLLLLKLFKHYLAPLLESGLVSVIIPPLFRINMPVSAMVKYAWSNDEHLKITENNSAENPEVMRLKGVAQFNAAECAEMFLNPASRQLLQVRLVDQKLQLLMEK